MKKKLLCFFIPCFLLASINNLKAQLLYSNTTLTSQHYVSNPGFVGLKPSILLDDVQIDPATLGSFDTINITKIRFQVLVQPNAAASTVKLYYALVSDTSTSASTAPLIPVLLSTISLPSEDAGGGSFIISAGDSVTTLFSIPKLLNAPYNGYQTFFLGMSFSDSSSSTHPGPAWYFANPTQTNANDTWIYNPHTGFLFGNYGSSPAATLYMQVYGYPTTTLAVHFLSFNGELQNNEAVLNWSTASEINNKGFEVERSTDGQNFSDIGFVAGNGTTTKVSNYSYADAKLVSGNNYYRLKQVDLDGKTTYSSVINLQFSKFDWSILGNPANNSWAQIQLDKQYNVSIQIVSLSGKVIQTINKGNLDQGTYSIPLDLSHAASGLYIVRLIANGQSFSKEIVK